MKGNTDKPNDEWSYHFESSHKCKMEIAEMILDKKVVWRVEDNFLNFTKDPTEWTGNEITFEIFNRGNQTQLVFTQVGLVPTYECYDVFSKAWMGFIDKSLKNLIATGKGQLKRYLNPLFKSSES